MKRNLNTILLALLAGAALLVSACATKEAPGKEPDQPKTETAKITVLSGQAPVIADAGGSFTVEFSSNLPWKVTPAAAWVTVDPASGNAGDRCSITVNVLENKTYNERSSKVTLSCGEGDNSASAEVSFTQKQKGALILSESEVFVEAAGGEISIKVKTTSDLTVSIAENAASWITQVKTKDIQENELSFQIAANEDYDPREGVITFTNDTGSDQVTVKQVAKGALILSDSEINVDSEGEVITIKVTANSEISYEIEEAAKSWITPSTTKGLVENVLQFTIAANEDYDPRQGVISFSGEAGKQDVTIKQAAKGALIISQKEYNVGAAGELIEVTVKANSDISYEIAEAAKSWITESPTKGLVDNVLFFQIAANEEYDPREGTITFTNEAGSDVVTVKQAANGALFVDPVSFELDHNGGEISFTVQASSEVTVTVAEEAQEWIIPASTKALSTETYEFVVLENTAFVSRTGEITVSSADGEQTVTVTQGEAPSSTLLEISTVAEFLEFAQKYNAGDYKEAPGLLVKLLSDLAFTDGDSDAFDAIGGIGLKVLAGDAEDYYFDGVFDGNNKTISGLQTVAPLFKAIDSEGVVKDLTIDNTCSFGFARPDTAAEAMFGAIAGYHKGLIDNVKVNADITLSAAAEVEYMTTLGGLVGRATTGQLTGCEYTGLISTASNYVVAAPDEDANKRKLIIGGLVGRFSNAGSIANSAFRGAIGNEAQIGVADETTDDSNLKRNPYLVIGGIVGHLDGEANVTSCFTTADHAVIASLHASSNGQIVNKPAVAYYSAVGGIVGESNNGTVSDCTNGAIVVNTIFKASTDDSRYINCGGIVGKNNANGTINGCANNAAIYHRANPKIQDIGGIAGYNAGTVSGCSNNGSVYHSTTGVTGATKKGGRVVSLGGVIGENTSTALVSDVHNTALIEISAMEDGNKSEARMGGIIAYNMAPIDGGSGKNITTSGQVNFTPNFQNQFTGYMIGGAIGYTTASVKNVKASSYVYFRWNSDANVASKAYLGGVVGMMNGDGEITGCVNEGGEGTAGEVYLNVKAGAAKHTDNYVGGVVGKVTGNVAISDCSNSGYVHGGNSTKQNGTSCYVGGIAAYLDGASSITNCVNSGVITNNHSSNSTGTNNTCFNGGIVAWVQGAAETPITITGCSHNTAALSPRRGYSGGIVGYANYATVSNCNVGAVDFSGSAYFIGGIAGWAVNSTISGCGVEATTITSSQTQSSGGVVAKLGEASVIDGCSTKINSITGPTAAADGITYLYGAVAGQSVEGSTIKDSHYPASGSISGGGADHPWQICGDTNFTDGGGNAADL